jgi:urease accessory protein
VSDAGQALDAGRALDAGQALDGGRALDAGPAGSARTVAAAAAGWQAALELRLSRRDERTVLSRNRHQGPLQVQKALYPEGPATCHIAVLHPPGGIVAGDSLRVEAHLESGARGLLTTPGATKWYRSEGDWARQSLDFRIEEDAILEWLPRENILFDGSQVAMRLDVDLASRAAFVGWDIVAFGRRASGESWRRGRLQMRTMIRRADRLLWSEVADVDAHSGFAQSKVGLAGFTVCGTLVVAGDPMAASVMSACRDVTPGPARSLCGLTQVPGVLIARYLGHSTEDAFAWFTALWAILRHSLSGRVACPPRVWAC